MATFQTDHGTVRYSGIRRYIVVSGGRTVKRTDSIETARKTQADWRWHGASVVDTRPQAVSERTCSICMHPTVKVLTRDFEDYGAHWNCLPEDRRKEITAEHQRIAKEARA